MRVLKLTPVFMFILLLVGPVLLIAGQAYAECCMCGWGCYLGCSCPGQDGCAYCAMGDPETVQSNPSANDTALDIRGARVSQPSTVTKSDVTERLEELTRGGKRDGVNFTLKLFDYAVNTQKFACPKKALASNLVFQMQGDAEK